jgi:hypothetical protein
MFNVLIDGASGRIWLRLDKSQSNFYQHLVDVVVEIEAEFGRERVVARLHTDAHTTFRDQKVTTFCRLRGIKPSTCAPFTPNGNALAERTLRTICEMASAMLITANAPPSFWGEAVMHAVWLLNFVLPYKAGAIATRDEIFTGREGRRATDKVLPWGCVVWAHEHLGGGKALGKAKAQKFVYLGYDEYRSSFRLGADHARKIVFSGHVIAKEDDMFWAKQDYGDGLEAYQRLGFVTDNAQCNRDVSEIDEDQLAQEAGGGIAVSRERRTWTPSAKALDNLAAARPMAPTFGDKQFVNVAMVAVATGEGQAATSDAPRTWREAMARPDAADWVKSGRSEFESQRDNKMWGDMRPTVRLKAEGVKVVPAGDVLTVKRDGRKKTRTVMRGYLMEAGVHYNQTFAPVVQLTTLRVLLALATKLDWEVKQGDCPTAFQQALIDCEIWATPSEAYRHFDKKLQAAEAKYGRGKVAIRVLKSMPGIPQGSRLWNEHLHKILTKLGFRRSEVDRGLYIHTKFKLYFLVWVDDIFPFYPKGNEAKAKEVWAALQRDTGIGELADISDCLGCEVVRDRARRVTYLHQAKAVRSLQARLKMENCNGPSTPMAQALKLSRDLCPTAELAATSERKTAATSYRSEVASLIYIAAWTRPDIAYSVGLLARQMHNPSDEAMVALKRLLRYVFTTADYGLVYDFSGQRKRQHDEFGGYYDASFGDCPDTKRSTGGHCVTWFGCVVAWLSKLHPYITTSTNHSEYVAGASCVRECTFQGHLAEELGMERPMFKLWSDNTGNIRQTQNPCQRAATKHIEIADHFIREQCDKGRVAVSYIDTKDMVADIFTKALGKDLFIKHRGSLVGPVAGTTMASEEARGAATSSSA